MTDGISSSSTSSNLLQWPKQLKLLQGPLYWGNDTQVIKCQSYS